MAHIVRVDKLNRHTIHGYQVRGTRQDGGRYFSKLFSDNRYGGPVQAQAAAQAFLDEYSVAHPVWPQYPHGFYEGGKLLPTNTSGVTGVCRTHDYGRHDRRRRDYWAACYNINAAGQKRHRQKRFYVEDYGEEDAKRLAIEFRQMWEEAARQGVEAVREFFSQYEAGWLTEGYTSLNETDTV